MMDKIVAIVEDELAIAKLIARSLEAQGFRTESFRLGEAFLASLRRDVPSLCVLDLNLPDVDGIELLGRIREVAPLPIIILSVRDHVTDRIVGLELGADDYVIKPFDPREVVARVRAVLRRVETEASHKSGIASLARFAGWTYEPSAMALKAPDGRSLDLSAAEARLLEAFLEAPQRVLSREFLLTRSGSEDSFDRSIDVRVSRLRKKLEVDGRKKGLVRTVYGAGYLLTCAVEWKYE